MGEPLERSVRRYLIESELANMRRLFTVTAVAVIVALPVIAFDQPYGGLRLLDGYTFERSHTFDTINGVISKDGGLRIEFESGVSEGYAVDPGKKSQYIWYREQVVNGHKVMLALTNSEGTPWRPEKERNPKPRQILMVTFPGRFGGLDAANFSAEVLNQQEVVDMLLMVLTFDPNK